MWKKVNIDDFQWRNQVCGLLKLWAWSSAPLGIKESWNMENSDFCNKEKLQVQPLCWKKNMSHQTNDHWHLLQTYCFKYIIGWFNSGKISRGWRVPTPTMEGTSTEMHRNQQNYGTPNCWYSYISLTSFKTFTSNKGDTFYSNLAHVCQHPAGFLPMTASKRQLGCWQQTATG